MENIELLQKEYNKFISWGYSRLDSIRGAMSEAIKDTPIIPHVCKDEYGDFSHVFYKGYVLFEDGEVYKKVLD